MSISIGKPPEQHLEPIEEIKEAEFERESEQSLESHYGSNLSMPDDFEDAPDEEQLGEHEAL